MDQSYKEIATIATENLSREELLNYTVETLDCLTVEEITNVLRRTRLVEADLDSIDGVTSLINDWHDARQIVPNSSPATQALKAMSEMGELADNIIKGKDVTDDIGDIYVCLCSIARLSNTTIHKCILHAYTDIKDRKGTLLLNGNFVKDDV